MKRRRSFHTANQRIGIVAGYMLLGLLGAAAIVLIRSSLRILVGALLALDLVLLVLFTRRVLVQQRLGQAKRLLGQGYQLMRRGEVKQAEAKYAEALRLYARIGTKQERADALRRLGDLFTRQGKPEEAKAHYDEALRL